MINKKHQIFISSTFTDLLEERQAAVSAILSSGNIPAGMELFKAGDQSQLEIIYRWIDNSDIYILILGGRYGSIVPGTELSYTELEYDYAQKKGKPLFSIVINEKSLDEKVKVAGRTILENDHPQKLKAFREKVVSYPVAFFENTKDIEIAIYRTLPEIISDRELSGWVSGKDVPNSNGLLAEITRLTTENIELKSKISLIQENNVFLGGQVGAEIDSEKSEFEKIKSIFESRVLLMTSENSGVKESVKISLLKCINLYRGYIIEGLATNAPNEFKSYLIRNVCTALQVYSLMKPESFMDGRFKRYELTEKGGRFFMFLDIGEIN